MTDQIKAPDDVRCSLTSLETDYVDIEQHFGGANGYLFFARNKITRQQVAIKFYCGEQGERQHEEPEQLSQLDSNNVLKILDARQAGDEWAYFITPRCVEGNLDDLIATRPSVHRAIEVAIGICSGVNALHALHMVHRDLKPANIVLLGGKPQIADFGSVRQIAFGSTDVVASSHSVLYRPPESFDTGRYDYSGDIYQIGLVTYQLLGGDLPYEATRHFNKNDQREYAQIYDPIDRSMFQDAVIKRRTQSGSLIRTDTLPPWIDIGAKRVLNLATNPTKALRQRSVSDLTAALTGLRARLKDWRWAGNIALLPTPARRVELRPLGENLYEAFHNTGSGFRRAPGSRPNTLAVLVRQYM